MTYSNNQFNNTNNMVGSSSGGDNRDIGDEKKADMMNLFKDITPSKYTQYPKHKRKREEGESMDAQEIFRRKFRKAIEGYRMDNPVCHRRNRYLTSLKRPSTTISRIPNRGSLTVSVDNKEEWPVQVPHLTADPDFNVVLSEKPTLPPPKVYPQSREEFMKKAPVSAVPPVRSAQSSSCSSSVIKPKMTYDSNIVESLLDSITAITEKQKAARCMQYYNSQKPKWSDVAGNKYRLYAPPTAQALVKNKDLMTDELLWAKEFPKSFESIVIQGDLSSGVNLNGEAGVETAPMYPFSPVSSVRHAAIAIKVILGKFIEARDLEFKLLKGPEDYL
ncbi:hypothetical protein BDB01DRAFT_881676 [Pilobolus umbonatus]|nr:hypothetical protein BDB01DRAFT_881676 [Pilobolus umbonatus]